MSTIFQRKNVIIAVILFAIAFPYLTDNTYYIHIMSLAFIWTIAVYGLNLLAGYTGYLSLAHAGFFAIGAYSIGLLTVKAGLNYWLAFILAILITSFLGLLIGLISLRTKEHFFAIYTLCVGYVIYLVIDKWDSLTGGVRGLIGIPAPANIGPISFQTPVSLYYLILFFMLLAVLVAYRIVNSLTGRTYIAIRNSEELALTMGIDTGKNKLVVFVISTAFAGVAGALYASFIRFIGPEVAYTTVVFDLLTFLLVGGIGTLTGPIVGTLLIVWISQQLQFLQDYRMLIFGPVLTLLVIFYPRGLVGGFYAWKMKREHKRAMKANSAKSSDSAIGAKDQVKEG
ncbi:branched-chain amino acid ABC transporter permease [Mesobacillus harenae]|uniref:branched-chain amino acid ABC transporter permease n=1 Tax=Mesobacillus harenae TaxID=2213203 RepID=UPI001580CB47|nr:branched-chain amino acid ABC transporter permease [Mesobacillus harenae]